MIRKTYEPILRRAKNASTLSRRSFALLDGLQHVRLLGEPRRVVLIVARAELERLDLTLHIVHRLMLRTQPPRVIGFLFALLPDVPTACVTLGLHVLERATRKVELRPVEAALELVHLLIIMGIRSDLPT